MADKHQVTIAACPDGPLLVRGGVTVLDENGDPVPNHRPTVALCRCGGSQILPMCDGTHRSLRRPQPRPGPA
jgi:CDGSH-type Zn-finger protein